MERLYWFSGNGKIYHCRYFLDMTHTIHGVQIYDDAENLIGFIEDLVIPDGDIHEVFDFNHEIGEYLTNKFI